MMQMSKKISNMAQSGLWCLRQRKIMASIIKDEIITIFVVINTKPNTSVQLDSSVLAFAC